MSNLLLPSQDLLEIGIDEAGRGCLAGPVVAAAVCMPNNLEDYDEHADILCLIKDSKKMTPKNRQLCKGYIETYAIDWGVGIADNKEIDTVNILNATHIAMHRASSNLNITPDLIQVDGNSFKDYYDDNTELIDYKCIIGGDNMYLNIACSSILAKENHDSIIREYVEKEPALDERYDWNSNVCYGTKRHCDGIGKWGITRYHRRSFGICRDKEVTL